LVIHESAQVILAGVGGFDVDRKTVRADFQRHRLFRRLAGRLSAEPQHVRQPDLERGIVEILLRLEHQIDRSDFADLHCDRPKPAVECGTVIAHLQPGRDNGENAEGEGAEKTASDPADFAGIVRFSIGCLVHV
jgi:hypothetical protein